MLEESEKYENNIKMNIEDYRRKDIEKIITGIEIDITNYKVKAEEKKKLGKIASKMDLVVSLVGVVITLVFSIIGSNDIIDPKISIIVMEAMFSGCASLVILISRYGKMQNKKYDVYEKIRNYAKEKLNEFKILYSNVYEDGEISNDDYKSIVNFKSDYDHKKIFMKADLGLFISTKKKNKIIK